jgi:hypothetical protein
MRDGEGLSPKKRDASRDVVLGVSFTSSPRSYVVRPGWLPCLRVLCSRRRRLRSGWLRVAVGAEVEKSVARPSFTSFSQSRICKCNDGRR